MDVALTSQCPCGSGKAFGECCGPYLAGVTLPDEPENLMRSRYTAFVLRDGAYLHDTHDPDTRGEFTPKDFAAAAKEKIWCKLDVLKSCVSDSSKSGTVDFKAYFIESGYLYCHHEISTFVTKGGRWVYREGEFPLNSELPKKLGRNDPCVCGSDKKFKKCCGSV